MQELLAEVPQTIRSYDLAQLTLEQPRSAVDFFAENAVGFSAPIAPGHAFLSMRGAITNQIGYDDSSELSVQLNGRRYGNVNLSKISTVDVQTVEVLRGPSSVIYGSSAIGGVINFITLDGLTFEGAQASVSIGSWDRYTGNFKYGTRSGDWDYFVALEYQTSNDYKVGEGGPGDGTLENTAYERRTGNVTVGYSFDPQNRISLIFRSDGLYDVGHRGITYSLTDYDDRYTNSVDLVYKGATEDGRATWISQTFYTKDVEAWYWSQDPLLFPFSNAAAGDRPGISRDNNFRINNVYGQSLSGTYEITSTNTLLAGLDLEYTRLRNTRQRDGAPGYVEGFVSGPFFTPRVDLAPLQLNYDVWVAAPYIEDTQKLFEDRLTLKAGVRFDTRSQAVQDTPFEENFGRPTGPEQPPISKETVSIDAVTYRAGATYKITEELTARANIGTGFRAPNPNELEGRSVSGNGVTSIGNPDLDNQKSLGWEVGLGYFPHALGIDVAFYSLTIEDRISGFVVPAPTGFSGVVTQGRNLEEVRVKGIEAQVVYDIAAGAGWDGWKLEPYASGNHLLESEIDDPLYATQPANNTTQIQRVNRYQLRLGLRAGQPGKWDIDLFGNLSGPIFESSGTHPIRDADLPFLPSGARNRQYIFRKNEFWVFSAKGSYNITERLNLFAGVNNIFDLNCDHSFLIRYDEDSPLRADPYRTQSRTTYGSSAPGREVYVGLAFKF